MFIKERCLFMLYFKLASKLYMFWKKKKGIWAMLNKENKVESSIFGFENYIQ